MAHQLQTDLFTDVRGEGSPAWTIELGGRTVHYSLRLSTRARKVWLKVDARGRLEVVVPRRMPIKGLESVIRQKTGWILNRVAPDGLDKDAPPALRFEHGAALPYLGTLYRLEVTNSGVDGPSAKLQGDRIIATVTDPLRQSEVREALVGWYRAEAARHIAKRVRHIGHGMKVNRLTIRDQKTRWASCSPSGVLSFNWRVVLTPPDVVDYLVVHELVHLERPDHSKAFWKRVEELCPDYRAQEAWLKGPGRTLFAL